MSEELKLNKNLSDEEIYLQLIASLHHLFVENDKILSALSNFTALLKQAFEKISWVGFYFLDGDRLFLGPFQGNIACVEIRMNHGVCGASAYKKATLIVEDVDKFPGHIACDSASKSEIVVPIVINNELIGVLDLDSYEYSSFNEIDKKYLEELLTIFTKKIDLGKFKII
ncbi:MAG: GAF domain-containing protein [Melioribacteraceae bacterium]|nr:GAF domain-containing protein [Melioribacteraceae bacterium]